MNIKWTNCTKENASKLNKWLTDYNTLSDNIKRFAMFDNTFSTELEYYRSGKRKYDERIDDYVKVVYVDGSLVAYVVINYFTYDGIKEIGVNPIVISPEYLNKGYGKYIIKDLMENTKNVIDKEVDIISVALSKNNPVSIKLFESLNFEIRGYSEDKTFIYFQYILNKFCGAPSRL